MARAPSMSARTIYQRPTKRIGLIWPRRHWPPHRLMFPYYRFDWGDDDVGRTEMVDADGDPHRAHVGPLHSRSYYGARVDGCDGYPLPQRQAAGGLGAAALFRPHQCG